MLHHQNKRVTYSKPITKFFECILWYDAQNGHRYDFHVKLHTSLVATTMSDVNTKLTNFILINRDNKEQCTTFSKWWQHVSISEISVLNKNLTNNF